MSMEQICFLHLRLGYHKEKKLNRNPIRFSFLRRNDMIRYDTRHFKAVKILFFFRQILRLIIYKTCLLFNAFVHRYEDFSFFTRVTKTTFHFSLSVCLINYLEKKKRLYNEKTIFALKTFRVNNVCRE